jgi:3-oxoacyl-[acyl-carrier protein] reductase
MMLSTMELATSLLPSTSVIEPIPGLVLSNAIRAGITSWAKTLAAEVARDGITVNTVMPGSFATDRTRRLDAMDAEDENTTPEEIAKRAQAQIPIGRYGTPAEFGALVAFLAGDRAAYMTDITVPVDGGILKS